jgi:hypothetical protein
MDRTLKIATWNTNGLTKQEIKTFIFSEKKKYIISEIHFINKNYFRIPDYTVSHNTL